MTVISLGTIFPSTMFFSMISPYSEPGCFLSALKRSPADRCTNLKSDWMRSLIVPLPAPGPPKMKITVVSFCINKNLIIPYPSFHANNERSSGHYLRGPSNIRSHVVKALYRSHIPRKVAVLTAQEIVIPSEVDKGKSPYSTLRYEVIEDLSLGLVEVVIEEGDGDVAQIGGAEDLAHREVHVGLDGEGGEGAAFPPVHAEEEERDDDDAAPDDRAHVTAEVHGLHLNARHVDVCVHVVPGLSVSQSVQSRLQGERVARKHEEVRVGVHHAHHAHSAHHAHCSHSASHGIHLHHVGLCPVCSVHLIIISKDGA